MQDTLNCMRIRGAPAMRTGRIGVCRMMPRAGADGYSSFPAHYAEYYKFIQRTSINDRSSKNANPIEQFSLQPRTSLCHRDPRIFPYQTFPNFADISCN
ncbi:hypothetical protein [Burkholderia ubonensis]|uniref:hypothetical protein n=1 Tax=Burkholderia ubonensis TaxID=101571 RepID=UPI0012FADB9D|nr:hypothetical protein [Burkholderia ubonensis]